MAIIATFVLNALLSFALGLLVARFLGPGEFGRYAVAAAAAVVINTVLFEWLRLSATRFYSERVRGADPSLRATLRAGYLAAAVLLAAVTALVILLGLDLGLSPPLLAAAAAAAGLGMGLFDYQAALARARFRERTYAGLVIAKSAAALILMAGGAYLYGDAALVLLASAASVAMAALSARRALADPAAGLPLARRAVASRLAAYAVPLVLASVIYQALPLLNRAALAGAYGFAEAGFFALAADIGVRIFMTAGSALDVLLFQVAVRRDELEGRAGGERQVARNFALVVALLLPLGAGLWLVLPAFEALLVPPAFRGAFAAYLTLLIPALFAYGLIQYALNPVFQLRGRTAPVVLAALLGLAVDAALVLVLPGLMGPLAFAAAQLGGLVASAAALLALAVGTGRLALPWRDLALSVLATAAMAGALWPLRGWEPHGLALPAAGALGFAVYGGLAAAFDIAGLRSALATRLASRRATAPAE